jgi:hypothetical protein
VLTAQALRDGVRAARERHRDIGEAVLGGIGPELCGVLPTLRSGDGAALCGSLLSALRRRELIDRYDEDWFRNPRAIAELRHEDTLARDTAAVDSPRFYDAIEAIAVESERALG